VSDRWHLCTKSSQLLSQAARVRFLTAGARVRFPCVPRAVLDALSTKTPHALRPIAGGGGYRPQLHGDILSSHLIRTVRVS
jgi:hypothetical protein